MKRVALLAGGVGVCLALTASPAAGEPAAPSGWMPPQCETVTGDGSMTFTWNDGIRLTPTSQPMAPFTTVSDVDVIGTNQLLAVSATGRLTTSTDSGCTWAEIADLEGDGPFLINPAPDGTAYVWTKFVDNRLYRVVGSTVTALTPPNEAVLALAVDPRDAAHLRVVTPLGMVLDTRDGGHTYDMLSSPPQSPGGGPVSLYDAAIAPTDLDRIVLGTIVDRAFTTTDAGRTWTQATMAAPRHRVNVFTVSISPVDPSVVWAMGLDITEHDSGATNEGRHIFYSVDGGMTFRPVVDHDLNRVNITNGLLLVPHPTDRDQVYFEYGTWFFGYGTDLYRYDAGLDRLTFTHNGYDDITAIAFHPRFPDVMYLGLSEIR